MATSGSLARLMSVTAAAKDSAVRAHGSADAVTSIDIPALYIEHWRALVRLASLLVDDVGSAEDVVQDVFLALHRQQAALRSADAALAYLRRSVVNRSRSVLRRRYTARRHQALADVDTVEAADEPFWVAEDQRVVLVAVRDLPRRQREVLVLRYWSGLSEREIAAALAISTGSVKSAASRGIQALKTTVEGQL